MSLEALPITTMDQAADHSGETRFKRFQEMLVEVWRTLKSPLGSTRR